MVPESNLKNLVTRRNLLRTALALPALSLFAPLERLTAADAGKVKITDIKMTAVGDAYPDPHRHGRRHLRLWRVRRELRMMKAWMEIYKPMLVNQDPLAIGYHWHRMSTLMHTYMARIPALSGIDMALWDLAGRLVNLPVYRLLGGPFREQVPMFHQQRAAQHARPCDGQGLGRSVSRQSDGVQGREDQYQRDSRRSHGPLHDDRSRAQDLNKLRTGFENVRKELGMDYDIMVHCHNEYDLATAKAIARAVEEIQPKWFEDPLPPQFSDSWVALKRECRVPLLTGEKCEMPQGFYPFLKEQAVDYIYPDIAFCGGITAFMKIASTAALFRIPVATHNVGGIYLTMSCIQVGLSIMDFLTSETAMDGEGRRSSRVGEESAGREGRFRDASRDAGARRGIERRGLPAAADRARRRIPGLDLRKGDSLANLSTRHGVRALSIRAGSARGSHPPQ